MSSISYFLTVLSLFSSNYYALVVNSHTISDQTNHNHRNTSLDNILRSHNSSALDVLGLEQIFQRIGFTNCTKTPSLDCNKCLTADQLMELHGFNTKAVINQTMFNELATSIVYFMLPASVNTTCTELKTKDYSPSNVFTKIGKNYNTSELNGELLDKILEDINTTRAQILQKEPCFSAGDILINVGIVEHDDKDEADLEKSLTHAQFQLASGMIVDHLVSGYCIKESHHHEEHHEGNLPDKVHFISELFHEYGVNGVINAEGLESLFKVLGIVKADANEKEGDDHDHDHDHDRRRRNIDELAYTSNRIPFGSRRARSATDGNSSEHKYEQCYSAKQIMEIFEVKTSEGIKHDKFQELCPAMIQQLETKICLATEDQSPVNQHIHNLKLKVWGYGILAVTIISILSLAGVFTIPFIGKSFYDSVMTCFMALAVGTLCGDGLIHLLPHSLGLHDDQGAMGNHDHDKEQAVVQKCMVVVAAIYSFYIFEFLVSFFAKCKSNVSDHSHGHSHGQGLTVIANPSVSAEVIEADHKEVLNCMAENSNSALSDQKNEKPRSAVNPLALLLIIGDTMHNVVDGIAIGVAFSEMEKSGISGGLSTSIAVFCHELPHELGDFAILVATGMSVKRALLFNFLSACFCYIGLFIGIGIGEVDEARLWVFAITAGMFIYVSLVTVLPEMMRNKDIKTAPLRVFILQNLGLLTGFIIMSLLAIYEEDIKL